MAERIEVTVNGTVYTVEIDSLTSLNGTPVEVRVNGKPYTIEIGKPNQSPPPARQPATPVVQAAAPAPAPQPAAPVPAPQPAPPKAAPPSGGPVAAEAQSVTAPMPGKILSVAVSVGDTVKEKDTLCTLEAMKMEMSIAAPTAGTVREIRAQVGENVSYGDVLFVIG